MTEPGARATYHPLPHRSPDALRMAGREAVVVKVAEDDTGRAMLLFPDLTLLAAVPDEMEATNDRPGGIGDAHRRHSGARLSADCRCPVDWS